MLRKTEEHYLKVYGKKDEDSSSNSNNNADKSSANKSKTSTIANTNPNTLTASSLTPLTTANYEKNYANKTHNDNSNNHDNNNHDNSNTTTVSHYQQNKNQNPANKVWDAFDYLVTSYPIISGSLQRGLLTLNSRTATTSPYRLLPSSTLSTTTALLTTYNL